MNLFKTVNPVVGSRAAQLLTLCALAAPLALTACSRDSQTATTSSASATGTGGSDSGTGGSTTSAGGSTSTGATGTGGAGGVGGTDPGPDVDVSDPQLYSITFKPNDADPAATTKLGNQPAYLDTR